MYQIVIDTNVLVAALRSKQGASHRLLRQLGHLDWQVNISTALVLEYEEVLTRQVHRLGLSEAIVATVLDRLCALGRQNDLFFRWRPGLLDPDDDFILDLAIRCHCDFIVTFNVKNFLSAREFGIQVVTPAQFLRKIESCEP